MEYGDRILNFIDKEIDNLNEALTRKGPKLSQRSDSEIRHIIATLSKVKRYGENEKKIG